MTDPWIGNRVKGARTSRRRNTDRLGRGKLSSSSRRSALCGTNAALPQVVQEAAEDPERMERMSQRGDLWDRQEVGRSTARGRAFRLSGFVATGPRHSFVFGSFVAGDNGLKNYCTIYPEHPLLTLD